MGQECLRTHASGPGKSQCDRVKKCHECCKVYNVEYNSRGQPTGYRHRCGYANCEFCDKYVDLYQHQCYIQKVPKENDDPKTKRVPVGDVGDRRPLGPSKKGMVEVEREPPLFVYADYEAVTDDEGYQSAILIGYETSESDDCNILYGDDCTRRFIDELESVAIDRDGVIVIFHNLKGYDGMFLLQYMYANHREVTAMVTVGVKIMSFSSDRLTFKDSLCFLPFALASFSSAFGLTELHKGFFPHKFNRVENQEYEGVMPPKDTYDPPGMSPKKRADFDAWYDARVTEGFVFNLVDEMTRYCTSDVKLLKAGCAKFVEEFRRHSEFDPLEKCITIAFTCNWYWRKCHLVNKTVAIQPPNGWKGAQPNQSVQARQWMSYVNHRLRDNQSRETPDVVRHAFNGGEVRIRGMLVDGFDERGNTVYEFNGCFYHGCPSCYPHQRHITTSRRRGDRTFQECFEFTLAKKAKLEAAGYNVISMWECQWNRDKKWKEPLKRWLETWNPTTPLEPRDAFFGGRTNAVKLHHTCQEGETILYQDVTSLYPRVNKYGRYPIGHPTIITEFADGASQDLGDYFGLAKASVDPPRRLFHPVLPYRHGGKLTFPLCRTCVETQMALSLHSRSSLCPHDGTARRLTGTWCTSELREALAQGYTIHRLYEVWHFPQQQQRCNLFAGYVDKWLKEKTEASGYPHWADTPEKKREYVVNYERRERIALDPEKIVKNPGRKATAKLMLNSFWGKFGENLRKSKTKQLTCPSELYDLVTDPLKEVTSLRICSEDVLEVNYTAVDDECVENGKTNLFVAAFTTCHARLKLYYYLKVLGEQVLYFDTDSVIYRHRRGQPKLPIGDYLGDLTDELEHGDVIVDFTSGGPKNYGYRTRGWKVECKVRVFSLGSVRGQQQLNYDLLRQNVLDELTDPASERRVIAVTNPIFFTRHPTTKRLRVMPHRKDYGLVFDKRVVDVETFVSYPYGYH